MFCDEQILQNPQEQSVFATNKKGELYRKNVGAVITNQDGKIMIGLRVSTKKDNWQMPQGGIITGEGEDESIFREVFEETGIKKTKLTLLCKTKKWYSYKIPTNFRTILWIPGCVGQMQKWYHLSFTGEDSDINILTQNPEFKAWKWEEPKNVIDSAIYFKKRIYNSVFKEFSIMW